MSFTFFTRSGTVVFLRACRIRPITGVCTHFVYHACVCESQEVGMSRVDYVREETPQTPKRRRDETETDVQAEAAQLVEKSKYKRTYPTQAPSRRVTNETDQD